MYSFGYQEIGQTSRYKFWNYQHFAEFKTYGPGSDKYRDRKTEVQSLAWSPPQFRVWEDEERSAKEVEKEYNEVGREQQSVYLGR